MTAPAIASPTAQMRLLDEADGPAFVALLRQVYGDTYSYRALYEPGGLASLVRSGKASLWGDFAPTGELLSHTAFLFKDPRGDYVESGLSFRGPDAARGTPDAAVWQRLFAWLDGRCSFVHQHTSTMHSLAQRYAARHMRARPSGLVIDYAEGERLLRLPTASGPMQALAMTTALSPPSPARCRAPRALPTGPFAPFVEALLASFGASSFTADAPPISFALERFERNDALSLERRVVVASTRLDVVHADARTDLVHVPCDGRMGAAPALLEAGYVPVGVRVHATRADEVVMQRLSAERRARAREALARAQLLAPGRALVAGWLEACARAS